MHAPKTKRSPTTLVRVLPSDAHGLVLRMLARTWRRGIFYLGIYFAFQAGGRAYAPKRPPFGVCCR